jgi:hypothetical protein
MVDKPDQSIIRRISTAASSADPSVRIQRGSEEQTIGILRERCTFRRLAWR